jgi:alpha-tubulin suppressor-like RCC1 family protein
MLKRCALWLAALVALASLDAIAQTETWGNNYQGQLGNGLSGLPNYINPTPIIIGPMPDVVAISGGDGHGLAARSDGTVMTWGPGGQPFSLTPVPVTILTNVVAVSAGFGFSLALKSDGTVWAWGNNGGGQLGISSNLSFSAVPVQTGVSSPGFDSIIAIEAGLGHSLALKADGTVWSWGGNGDGQLGLGDIMQRFSPQQISGLSNMIAIGGGDQHSIAVKSDGTLWGWGQNGAGQLGNGTITGPFAGTHYLSPVQNPLISGITQIATTDRGTVALKSNGTVWAWGYNELGMLGNGTFTTIPQCLCEPTPMQSNILNVTEIQANGSFHILARKIDGSIWAWGWNYEGQAGTGAASPVAPYSLPTPVQSGVGTGNVIFATGREFSLLSVPVVPIAAGANVVAQLGVARVTFANVTTPGTMTITAINPGAVGLPPPATFVIQSNVQAYSIATTAIFDNATVCIKVPTVFDFAIFSSLRILHAEGGVLIDRTTTRNYARREVCGVVTSFSPFLMATSPLPPAPVLNGASSRKTHGGSPIDLTLAP